MSRALWILTAAAGIPVLIGSWIVTATLGPIGGLFLAALIFFGVNARFLFRLDHHEHDVLHRLLNRKDHR